jgi:hypothetical protein
MKKTLINLTPHSLTKTTTARAKKGVYDSTFHKDATVTVWDSCNQGWIRTSNPSDQMLSTLSNDEREKVIAHTAIFAEYEAWQMA